MTCFEIKWVISVYTEFTCITLCIIIIRKLVLEKHMYSVCSVSSTLSTNFFRSK